MQHRQKRKRGRSRHLAQISPSNTDLSRSMCYGCMRPTSFCHCATIPTIENQTSILIAQHIRERSHPFNTARMVAKAFRHSTLVVDHPGNLDRHNSRISSNAGLLYPSSSAVELRKIPAADRPDQLVLLDGTWNHVKHLYKNWPALNLLPHYRLNPTTPGQYRIRLEPNEYSLSTVEATVLAMKILEPETVGLDDLLFSFQTMVDRQLAHPHADYSRSLTDRPPTFNFPHALINDFRNLVVVYGEAEPAPTHQPRNQNRAPVYWVARRLASRERFSATIESRLPVSERLLEFFQLADDVFDNPISINTFIGHWRGFCRPNDILVTYNEGSLRLLRSIGIETRNAIELKSVNFDPQKTASSLTDFFRINNVAVEPVEFPGRAGRRLANLATLVKHLRNKRMETAIRD